MANRAKLDDPRLPKLVRAMERGVRFLINHPRESWELFIAHRASLDDELNRRAWKDTLPRFALRPAALDKARYARFERFLIEQKVIESSPPTGDYAVTLD